MKVFLGAYGPDATEADVDALKAAGKKIEENAAGIFILVPHACSIAESDKLDPTAWRGGSKSK